MGQEDVRRTTITSTSTTIVSTTRIRMLLVPISSLQILCCCWIISKPATIIQAFTVVPTQNTVQTIHLQPTTTAFRQQQQWTTYGHFLHNSRNDYFEKDNDDDDDDDSHDDTNTERSRKDDWSTLVQDLERRQRKLDLESERRSNSLRTADCTSGVALVLSDWVRRLDVDYPLVVCGTASDHLYLANLESGQIIASTEQFLDPSTKKIMTNNTSIVTTIKGNSIHNIVPSPSITKERLNHVIHQLYGNYDGGGTLAVAVKKSLLCEAKRSGGVHVWRLNTSKSTGDNINSNNAVLLDSKSYQGIIPALQHCLVTALKLDDDYLWAATDEGCVEAYSLDTTEFPLTLRTQPDILWRVDGNGNGRKCVVLSLDVNPELGLAVVTTDSGTVELLSMEDDSDDDDEQEEIQLFRRPIASFVPPFDGTERRSSNVFPTCATIVSQCARTTINQSKDLVQPEILSHKYIIACGANDGSIFLQPLRMDEVLGNEIHLKDPLLGRIRTLAPKHFAAVKCITSPAPGLLLTAGLDSTLRLWDTVERKFLYQFVGYKVWLGSLWTDGIRIISDGADNTVILHDFSESVTSPSTRQHKDREDNDSDV